MDLIFQYYLAHMFQQAVCKTVWTMKVKMVGNNIKNKVNLGDLNREESCTRTHSVLVDEVSGHIDSWETFILELELVVKEVLVLL